MILLLIHKLFLHANLIYMQISLQQRWLTIFFFYRSVKMWNELPNELVSCKNLKHFRLKLKKFDLSKIFTSKTYK